MSHRAPRTPLTLAAVTQCLLRMLWHCAPAISAGASTTGSWSVRTGGGPALGVTEGLIDFGADKIVPFPQLMTELIEMIAEDADASDAGRGRAGADDRHQAPAQRQRTVAAEATPREPIRTRRWRPSSTTSSRSSTTTCECGVWPHPARSERPFAATQRGSGLLRALDPGEVLLGHRAGDVPAVKQLMSRSSTSEPSRIAACMSATSW